jgi:hypothetical protein
MRVPAGTQDGAGNQIHVDHWRDVWPGDPDYDAVYAAALHAYRVVGTPMPYADAQDRAAGAPPPHTE